MDGDNKKNMLFIKYTYFLFLMMVVLAGVTGQIHNDMTRIDKSKSLTGHVMHMESSLRYEFTSIYKGGNMSAGEVKILNRRLSISSLF